MVGGFWHFLPDPADGRNVLGNPGICSYQKAVKEKPLAQAVEEIRSEAQWASLEQVPDLYKKAVLAVEDHRYYTHHGIDWISMARVVYMDIRVMKPEQGGSTITQQLVKKHVLRSE